MNTLKKTPKQTQKRTRKVKTKTKPVYTFIVPARKGGFWKVETTFPVTKVT